MNVRNWHRTGHQSRATLTPVLRLGTSSVRHPDGTHVTIYLCRAGPQVLSIEMTDDEADDLCRRLYAHMVTPARAHLWRIWLDALIAGRPTTPCFSSTAQSEQEDSEAPMLPKPQAPEIGGRVPG